ncbi:hypothetical protein GALMADRAFT_446221 [Galerina marginata CBS 339.88]|uniref:Uncharacterized protein n=1 Tax=Galerina marginata (strain CBS 339.88) TaxID=685588 RepID=A0A067TBW9_GALM3|nr:hypothetical protein GALMADRAFT_446221 [Galerina marginata CBS 339.88]
MTFRLSALPSIFLYRFFPPVHSIIWYNKSINGRSLGSSVCPYQHGVVSQPTTGQGVRFSLSRDPKMALNHRLSRYARCAVVNCKLLGPEGIKGSKSSTSEETFFATNTPPNQQYLKLTSSQPTPAVMDTFTTIVLNYILISAPSHGAADDSVPAEMERGGCAGNAYCAIG